MSVILDVITIGVVAIGGALVVGVRKAAEEGAAGAIKAINWPAELARELEKTRGSERQELRFKSYGALWSALRPLAIYDANVLDESTAAELSKALSDWYFSECGGLMLTSHARDFYFALQDLLRAVGGEPRWSADRSTEDTAAVFRGLLQRKHLGRAIEALDMLNNPNLPRWPAGIAALGKDWRTAVRTLATDWNGLTGSEQFAVLQQVGSVLRTILVNDVESRLR